jgi:hypothetical protein
MDSALPPVMRVKKLLFLEGNLGLIGPGLREEAPLESFRLAAAAAVTETIVTRTEKEEGPSIGEKIASMGILMTTGLPISIGRKKDKVEKVKKTSELKFYLDLFAGGKRFRVDGQDFDYSCLGPEKQYSVMMNFKSLLKKIAGLSPQAKLNRGAEIILAGRPLREMGYQSLADLEKEEQVLLAEIRPQP